jgi:hypothetical protein
MYTQSYNSTVSYLATVSPSLPLTPGKTNNFFVWAEDTAALLAFIYSCNHEYALEDLVEAVKEYQEYEDEEEDEDDR